MFRLLLILAENETLETLCPGDGTCSSFGGSYPFPIEWLIPLVLACVALAAFLLAYGIQYKPT